jgi:CrcB protein
MIKILSIAIAGSIGALSRYWVSGWLHSVLGLAFPYGTLAVNIIGSFLIGLVMQISTTSTIISQSWRIPITIGFLGALTTFSTFSFETIRLAQSGAFIVAALNILLHVSLSLIAALLGLWIGKILIGA